jgi:hypothetical protein
MTWAYRLEVGDLPRPGPGVLHDASPAIGAH